MLRICHKIPQKIAIAFSGGIDSVAIFDFLHRSNRNIIVLHFNHGTEYANDAENFVKDFCKKRNIPIHIGYFSNNKPKNENSWREERYNWFEKIALSEKIENIVTCHHLNDAVEWWLLSSFKGKSRLIPRKRDIFIRPFLTNTKNQLKKWCEKNNLSWIQDPSNDQNNHDRNYIRNVIIPNVLRINPGLEKTILKKYLKKEDL